MIPIFKRINGYLKGRKVKYPEENTPIYQASDIKGLLGILGTWGDELKTPKEKGETSYLKNILQMKRKTGVTIGAPFGSHKHKHPDYLLVFSGKGTWVVGNHSVKDFNGPCILYAPSNLPHMLTVDEEVHFLEQRSY